MKLSLLIPAMFAVVLTSIVANAQQCQNSVSHPVSNVSQTSAHAIEMQDIVDTAVGNEIFKTLVAAVKAADLVDVLKSEGPFTVFAPTNEAFAKLPKGTVESLLQPENKEKLVAILKYHVVSGKVLSGDVVKLSSAKTVQGQEIAIHVEDGTVMINNAKVIKADIGCTNGVVHVIDTVILPKAE